jgi:hypothetical protein
MSSVYTHTQLYREFGLNVAQPKDMSYYAFESMMGRFADHELLQRLPLLPDHPRREGG